MTEPAGEEEEILYGDLEETAQTIQAQKLMDQLSILRKKNQNLQNEIQEWKEQVQLLLIEKKQVEDNMVKLFNTSLREIERKDVEIAELKATISQFRSINEKSDQKYLITTLAYRITPNPFSFDENDTQRKV